MKKPKNDSRKLGRLEEKILKVFKSQPETPLSHKEVVKKLGDANYPQDKIFDALNALLEYKKVVIKNSRYSLAQFGERKGKQNDRNSIHQPSGETIEGIVDATANGSAYIISEHSKRDIYVPASRMKKAIDGDRVKVRITGKRGGGRLEGEIVEIVNHSQSQFVGIIAISKTFAFLVPDKKMSVDFFIPLGSIKNAKHGDKVLIQVVSWADNEKDKNPIAEVIDVLGKPGENNAEMLSILVDAGFPLQFSEAALTEAAAIPTTISPNEIANRRDFRDVLSFTIDPFDAKDFDDALSIHQLKNGNWEIGVHIADVTHYVQPNTALDQDAYLRATSVYLVDRVLPMFPEKISNEICSLRPNEEKLCFSAVFELNSEAEIIHEWFGKTIIYSDRRFNYAEAQQIIDTGIGDHVEELKLANSLAKKLRAKRLADGSIDFGSEEVKFILDETGKPIEIVLKVLQDTNRLIEDFMLLANRRVAAFINKLKVPSVNRIHDLPDIDKLTDFQRLAADFGYQMRIDTPDHISQSLNKLLTDVKGKPEQRILETLAIRSMAKAAYSTRADIGHYGLAFKDYAHFTSPIRRYPDVMLHRILEQCLNNQPQYGHIDELERRCEHTSLMERKAMQAERESTKYKQVEYMSERLGQVFDGVISGVVNFGFFVEMKDNKCEGLVPIDTLIDDNYDYDQMQHAIVGSRRGKRYQLGSPVRVRVVKTDLVTRTMNLEVAK